LISIFYFTHKSTLRTKSTPHLRSVAISPPQACQNESPIRLLTQLKG
jgi:hypothetical protein